MKEFNLINTGHGDSLPDAFKTIQKGNSGNEPGQPVSFASMIKQADRTPAQSTTGTAFTSSLLGGGKMGKTSVEGNAGKANQLLQLNGKGAKIDGSLPGKINLMAEKGGLDRGGAEKLSEGNGLKESEAGKNRFLRGFTHGSLKPGVASESPKSQLAGAVVGKDQAFSAAKHARVAGLLGEKSVGGKNAAAISGDGGKMDNEGGRNSRAAMDASRLSGFSLKDGVAVNEKGAGEKAGAEKNSFTSSPGHKGEILHREMPQSAHSIDKNSSVGGYQNAASEAGSGQAVINESANNSGIRPQALINRIVNGVKGPGRVRIALNPPHLGTLDMDVFVRANKVHIILQAENNNVRQVLLSNMNSLRSSLHNQGLIVDSIDVSVQERSDRGYYESGRNETFFKDSDNREGNEEDKGGGKDSSSHASSLAGEDGSGLRSDGHISLFV